MESLQCVLRYHELTKHFPRQYARAPCYMDWATQPDPFRTYLPAPRLALDIIGTDGFVPYQAGFRHGVVSPAQLNRASISQPGHGAVASLRRFFGVFWRVAGGKLVVGSSRKSRMWRSPIGQKSPVIDGG